MTLGTSCRTGLYSGLLSGFLFGSSGCFAPTTSGNIIAATEGADTGVTGQGESTSADVSTRGDSATSVGSGNHTDGTSAGETSATTTGSASDTSTTGGSTGTGGATDSGDGTTTQGRGSTSTGTMDTGTSSDTSTSTSTGAGSEGPCIPQCDQLACGLDPLCGVSCGNCGTGETCLDEGAFCGSRRGYPDDFGFSGLVNPDVLFGHRISISTPVSLRRFGVIAAGPGNVRMALYRDQSGPDNLVAQSSAMSLLAGSNEQSVGPVTLPAGDYWLGIIAQTSTSLRRTSESTYETFYALLSYGDPFPATLSEAGIINDRRYNLYLVVDDG